MITSKNKMPYFLAATFGLLLFLYSYLFIAENYVPYEAQIQINLIIRENDVKEIKRVAANKRTEYYLTKLGPDKVITDISDYQGGTRNTGYYGARIGKQDIGIEMQKVNDLQWKVKRIYCQTKEDQ